MTKTLRNIFFPVNFDNSTIRLYYFFLYLYASKISRKSKINNYFIN